ncbi:MAG: Ig-like domain-containing protein [bacterium]
MKKTFIAGMVLMALMTAGWPSDAQAGWWQSLKEKFGIVNPAILEQAPTPEPLQVSEAAKKGFQLQVTETTPANGATNASISWVKIVFNMPMDASTIKLQVHIDAFGLLNPEDIHWNNMMLGDNQDTIVMQPKIPITEGGASVMVKVEKGARATNGMTLNDDYSFEFKARAVAYGDCPAKLYTPSDGVDSLAQTPSGKVYWWRWADSTQPGFGPREIKELEGAQLASQNFLINQDGSVSVYSLPKQPDGKVDILPLQLMVYTKQYLIETYGEDAEAGYRDGNTEYLPAKKQLTNIKDIQALGIDLAFLTRDGSVGLVTRTQEMYTDFRFRGVCRNSFWYSEDCHGVSNTLTEHILPDILTDVKAISGSPFLLLALKNDGTVWARGLNNRGQLGNGQIDPSYTEHDFAVIESLKPHKIVSIAAGYEYGMALTKDGWVYAWGANSYGQLGTGSSEKEVPTPTWVNLQPHVLINQEKMAYIAASQRTSLAIDKDGYLYMWGDNTKGQLSIGNVQSQPTPVRVSLFGKAMAAATSPYGSMAVRPAGYPCGWGQIPPVCAWPTTSDVNLCE